LTVQESPYGDVYVESQIYVAHVKLHTAHLRC